MLGLKKESVKSLYPESVNIGTFKVIPQAMSPLSNDINFFALSLSLNYSQQHIIRMKVKVKVKSLSRVQLFVTP